MNARQLLVNFRQLYQNFFNKRLMIAFLMGVTSGLPLLITITLMQAWAKESGISLTDIGLMSLVGLPYTLKFVWAPLFDRFTLPFLGRRRGWMMASQLALVISILLMGFADPTRYLGLFVISAIVVSFFSASQDIVIDAFRREDLETKELGLGSSYYVYGYRIGMLMVSGGGLILADFIPWNMVFVVMAACMVPGMLTTWWATEPATTGKLPRTFTESVINPFLDYFKREKALAMLVFILLYKIGDNMAGALTTPFYLELGFSKTEIGAVVKVFGLWATLIGSFIGGAALLKMGIHRGLMAFGILQMVSTLGFALLALVGYSVHWLTLVISFENLTAGMGTAAFVAFMATLTNKQFTATQYALLSSLMGVPRVLAASVTGYLAESMGWPFFFLFCTLIAIPGLMLLPRFAPANEERWA